MTAANNGKNIKYVVLINMIYNFIWSIAKIIFGIFSTMYFFCLSGVITLLIGYVKNIFYRHFEHEDESLKIDKSKVIGILLIIIGALFIGYMSKLFIWPEQSRYGMTVSIAIAAFSFGELGIAIFNIVRAKKSDDVLLWSLRNCNLASALFAITLTQTAILSAQAIEASTYNAITGIVAGGATMIIGLVVLIVSYKKAKALKS